MVTLNNFFKDPVSVQICHTFCIKVMEVTIYRSKIEYLNVIDVHFIGRYHEHVFSYNKDRLFKRVKMEPEWSLYTFASFTSLFRQRTFRLFFIIRS